MTEREILESILEKINQIAHQQTEHGDMIRSLVYASEVQKLEYDLYKSKPLNYRES